MLSMMDKDTLKLKINENSELINQLRELFRQEYGKNPDKYCRDDYEKIIDTKENWHCWRYLNYYNYDLDKSFDSMKANLKWRLEFNVNLLHVSDFAKELWLFSIIVCAGKDINGNLVIYFRGRFNYKPPPCMEQYYLQFLFYIVEQLDRRTCISKKFVLVFDQSNTILANIDLNLARWAISVRNSIPSRLEAILVIGVPFLMKSIINMILSWLPNEFKHLIHCGSKEDLLDPRIHKDQQLEYMGGELNEIQYRMCPPGTKWFKDIEKFQDEKSQKLFAEWIMKMAPDADYRQEMIDIQEKHDLERLDSETACI